MTRNCRAARGLKPATGGLTGCNLPLSGGCGEQDSSGDWHPGPLPGSCTTSQVGETVDSNADLLSRTVDRDMQILAGVQRLVIAEMFGQCVNTLNSIFTVLIFNNAARAVQQQHNCY